MNTVSSNELITRVDNGVGLISINRVERRNAVTRELDIAIRRAAEAHAANPEVSVLLITGEGNTFCAGADFSVLSANITGEEAPAYDPESHLRYVFLTRLAKPVIAAVNGAAYGSGLALALHCDIRIGAVGAKFRAPFADFGLVGEMGIPWHLSRLVGAGRAMEWMLTRRVIGAQEAAATGLVSAVLPDETFRADALVWAAGLVQGTSLRSLGVIKRQAWGAWGQSLAENALQGGVETALAITSDDFRARVAAAKTAVKK